MIKTLWDESPGTPHRQPQLQPVRGGSANTLIVLGIVGCILIIITRVAWVVLDFLIIYALLIGYGLLYTGVLGLAFIGVSFFGFYKRYDRTLCIVAAIGFFISAGYRAIPSIFLLNLLDNILGGGFLTGVVWRFLITGIDLFALLFGDISIFLFMEETADWRFALVAALGFLTWGIIPFIEAVMYDLFQNLLSYLPYILYQMVIISMVYLPAIAGAFLGIFFMWIDRFDH